MSSIDVIQVARNSRNAWKGIQAIFTNENNLVAKGRTYRVETRPHFKPGRLFSRKCYTYKTKYLVMIIV